MIPVDPWLAPVRPGTAFVSVFTRSARFSCRYFSYLQKKFARAIVTSAN